MSAIFTPALGEESNRQRHLAEPPCIWEPKKRPQPEERINWLLALRQHLETDSVLARQPEHAEARARLFAVAVACDDLPLIRSLGGIRHALGEASLADELDLIIAFWRSGEPEPALDISRRLLFKHPYDARFATLHAAILNSLRQPCCFPMPGPSWGDTNLRLVPLDHMHCEHFAWAYRDPDIAARCCLPQFANAEEWHAWLDDCRAFGDQMIFAVMHAQWGFIGSVSLILAEGIGFFYYWIATEFQGLGFGPKAASLLFELAETHWGLRVCYAKCFADNQPSLSGLAKLGFELLDVHVRTEYENELHFRRVTPGYTLTLDAATELRFLFERISSTSVVAEIFINKSS
ncbi:GNAT family N-acetyltransferase [Hylemonella gracilis]|uniref:N-acetyltransferase domain-containing protein n=1 Tax=Hylemonella gracilis ATCC 19624 TaxID=887062 RepID=F3KSI0_9BURK|nr:GNAT family N-acetyltransferase [Hylemonella gracilis]EGI77257.1 hypothetical protein HGR_07046 [Hylemonella gracilis ATCC 19624]